jgi:hypothetical protein
MNSALSVWQLVIMAVVPLAALCGWIITIFVVAREPRAHAASASASAPASPTRTTVAGNGSGWAAPADEAAGATVGGQDQPVEPPGRRLAA